MSDVLARLRSGNVWLNEGSCCGQVDADGRCFAPACIRGDALKMFKEAADEIERLTVNGIHTCHDECERPVCKLRRERDSVLAANRDVMLNWEVLKADYDRLRAALEDVAASGLLHGSTILSDKVLSIVHAALETPKDAQ